jgi:alcohol dehydrogenase (cytochrome c)
MVQANRNGFLYILDRTNGKFLKATPFVRRLNWATGVDASGRPVLSGRIPTPQGTYICPGITGATNWFSPSYNPDLKLFYFISLETCNLFFTDPKPFTPGQTFYDTGTKLPPDEHAQKTLLAYSVPEGKLVWSYSQVGQGDSWGGTLATAGGLVFFGDDADSFEAVEARTGRPLWHFNTGQKMHASPMSYMVEGVQYVVISAGSDVFSFSLPH